LAMPILIRLVTAGIELEFEGKSQRLQVITVHSVQMLELSYKGKIFSAGVVPTVHLIYDRFGPSEYPSYNKDYTLCTLTYPGIAFTIAIPEALKRLLLEQHDNKIQMSILFSNSGTLVMERMFVYYGESISKPALPPIPDKTELVVNPSQGITIFSSSVIGDAPNVVTDEKEQDNAGQSPAERPVDSSNFTSFTFTFTSSPQDVLSQLGDPAEIFLTDTDLLGIHGDLRYQGNSEEANAPDYIYNYFDLGLDILFSGVSHTIKKFILHTNLATHPHFDQYNQCNYRIIPQVDNKQQKNQKNQT